VSSRIFDGILPVFSFTVYLDFPATQGQFKVKNICMFYILHREKKDCEYSLRTLLFRGFTYRFAFIAFLESLNQAMISVCINSNPGGMGRK
jgi:hypothetical protein